MLETQILSNHLLAFFRILRDDGLLIGTQEMSDGLRALEFIDITDLQQFRLVLQIVLCSSREEQEKFDEAFIKYFLNRHEQAKDMLHFLAEKAKKDELKSESTETVESEAHSATKPSAIGINAKNNTIEDTGKDHNKITIWTATNIMNMESQEITTRVSSYRFKDMEKAAKTFVNRIRLKQSRRYKVSHKGAHFDFRKTLRKSIQMGGYPIQPVWVGPKQQKANYILLCDSSRSMSSYAGIFLQFSYALSKCTNHVEVFLFSTKLRRVTNQFRSENKFEFPELTIQGNEWGGGTCIGESLYTFVQQYGSSLLKKNTVVFIASDGLDTGETAQLEWAMREIHSRTSSVIWFNPLLNIEGYEPIAQGMKTALPFIDLFSEAANASSFLKLANTIKIRR